MTWTDVLNGKAEHMATDLEGFKVEVVGGRIIVTPQSNVQSWTIFEVHDALRAAGIGRRQILSDVLFTFPGEGGRCPDIAVVEEGAATPYSYEDLLAAVEIVSTKEDVNDYEIKFLQYATYGVPVYLLIDPFRAECLLYTRPEGGTYQNHQKFIYGETVPLPLPEGITVAIPTEEFQRKD
ncbi:MULTISPECIES: Uma2 family endonuclease [unclassified Streptomyces]|uniref:Uma2 family endonuclease n=1 Tax=unclassified Streptomyces TaxID=2593676 RepID=UPI002E2BFCDA|nr:Uma2 family endonuclease [Streptomyces sp. NBC_00223]